MSSPLASPPIDAANIEHTFLSLWREWLVRRFDGVERVIGGRTMTLPLARSIDFQQASLTTPLDGLGIHVVWARQADQRMDWDRDDGDGPLRVMRARTRWAFLVRARFDSKPAAQAAKLAMDAASQLYMLLSIPSELRPLAQKGVGHVRPENPIVIAEPASGYAVRQIGCSAVVSFEMLR